MKQVFISYSRSERDQVLARAVARALESAGFSAWLDEEKLPPGEPLEEDLRSAIEQSDAGIFLVSNSWLERKWCRWEIQQFGLRPTPARLVAVLRQPREQIVRRLGPDISDLLHLVWHSDDDPYDERLWVLYCGVTGIEPGPQAQWAAKGAPLAASALATIKNRISVEPMASSPSKGPYASRSLTCDRSVHWGTIITHAGDPRHEVLGLVGPSGFGHSQLLKRIAHELTDPPRVVKDVTWDGRQPQVEADLLELVLRALTDRPATSGDIEARLADTLRAMLATRNVVLLFPTLTGGFTDSPLSHLYTSTLPRILGTEPSRHHLKCVQAIEWLPAPTMQRLLQSFTSFFAEDPEEDGRERAARKFVDDLQSAAAKHVPFTLLPVLDDVPRGELEDFLKRQDLTAGQRDALLRRVLEVGRTPDAIFTAIDKYYDEFRGKRL
jgi:hypothetical protein